MTNQFSGSKKASFKSPHLLAAKKEQVDNMDIESKHTLRGSAAGGMSKGEVTKNVNTNLDDILANSFHEYPFEIQDVLNQIKLKGVNDITL
jgi:hypothetical protein